VPENLDLTDFFLSMLMSKTSAQRKVLGHACKIIPVKLTSRRRPLTISDHQSAQAGMRVARGRWNESADDGRCAV